MCADKGEVTAVCIYTNTVAGAGVGFGCVRQSVCVVFSKVDVTGRASDSSHGGTGGGGACLWGGLGGVW